MTKKGNRLVRLGIFITLGVLFFIGGLYYIGNLRHKFESTVEISAKFKSARGLKPGNNVVFSGISVGTIKRIELLNDTAVQIFFVIEDEAKRFIHKNSVAIIEMDGLMGSKVLNILSGPGRSPEIVENDIINSKEPTDVGAIMDSFTATGRNTEELTGNRVGITNDLNVGKGALGSLLKDSLIGLEFKQSLSNLQQGTAEFNKILKMIRGDLMQNLTATTKNAENITNNLSYITQNTRDSLLTDLQIATNNVVLASNKLISNKGTVGKLLNDTAFAMKIEQTIINVKDGAANVNEIMEAAKSNIIFRGYFRKKAKADEEKGTNIQKDSLSGMVNK